MLTQISSKFLTYFQKNEHIIVPSSSVIPIGDKSLMFTNSGMVQFKDVFIGKDKKDYIRATSCQKSIRAGGKHNDLDNVGYTNRHHTFFEMLGNFSFGDYFKEKAIFYAWNFITNELKLDKNKLFVTVYHTDDEAYNLWKKIANWTDSEAQNKITRIKTDDNFWFMGDSGPCGPSSEIFYDLGEESVKSGKIRGGNFIGGVGENDRFIEIWNLVFMQYEKSKEHKNISEFQLLPKPSIDTGMGLERVVSILENKIDNYEINDFTKLINRIKSIYGNHNNEIAYRVIADHIRCMSFLIADGILPDREGRGYVLRRIMRRSMRYAYQLDKNNCKMFKLIVFVIEMLGDRYPELLKNQTIIENIIIKEENGFRNMLDRGMVILDKYLSEKGIF